MIERQCDRCGETYEVNAGRGRKSPVCPECRKILARERATLRSFAVMSASMIEVSQMAGPALAHLRSEVAESQGGRCFHCNRRRRRLFLQAAGDTHVGQCIECFMRSVYRDD